LNLIKRIGFTLFTSLALFAGIWAYISIKNSKRPSIEALSFLPDSCTIYLNTSSFSELNKRITSQSLVFDKLKAISEVNKLCFTLNQFDSLTQSNQVLKDELDGALIHLAVYGSSNDWLAAFNIKELGKQTDVMKEVITLFNARELDSKVYKFNLANTSTHYFYFRDGVALVSNSKSLLDKSLNSSLQKFSTSKNYLEAKATLTENNLVSVFINHQLLSQGKLSSLINAYSTNNRAFTAGAIGLEPSELKSTGVLKVDSTDVLFYFTNQQSQSPDELAEVLPENVSKFKAYGFDNYSNINNRFKASELSSEFWKYINDKALYNLKNEFYENVKNHLVQFTCNDESKFLAVQINDSIKAVEHLKFMSDSVVISDASTIYQIHKQEGLHPNMFNSVYEGAIQYGALFNSYVLYSDSLQPLSQLIHNLKNGLTAYNNLGFAAYKNQNFPDTYNYLFYTSPSVTNKPFSTLLTAQNQSDLFENFKHFSYCLINDKDGFKYRCELQHEPENKGKDQNNLWAFKMDSTSTFKPFEFVNHQSRDNEIVVQDNSNTLYLLSNKGKLLWKKKLIEKINSGITRVDAFKNGKYQLLFSSSNYIHLIDRNSDYVTGFPVKLEAECTMPLCVFDYESKLDYRLFVACKNNKIYSYTIQGKLNEGFSKVSLEKEMRLPLQYVKVGGSDYLVGIDIEGKIYTFSRKGEPRIGLKNRAIINCSAFMVDVTTNIHSTYIIYVDDKSGAINKISMSDKKEIVNLNYESEGTKVKYTLVDDNREMDLVTTLNQKFATYNLTGDVLLTKQVNEELGAADFYGDESHAMYFAPVKEKNLVLVYQSLRQKTTTIEATSMPLVSNLFGNNKKYFIVCNGRWLYCKAVN